MIAMVAPPPSAAQAAGSDYPWSTANYNQRSTLGFDYRNCTDFVAWRLNTQVGVHSKPWRFTWSNLAAPDGNGNAAGWKDGAIHNGHRVDNTAAVGAVAWWGASSTSRYGHVAIVSSVNADGSANIEEYNQDYRNPFTYGTRNNIRAEKYLHIADVSNPAPGQQPPGAPGAVQVLAHKTRVNLQWPAAAGASEYQIMRNGVHLSTVAAPTFLDAQVSPEQAYSYTIVARNSAGATAGPSRYVQNTGTAADRAYLGSKWGPAICGRAGDQSNQLLVCNIRRSTGWTTSYSPRGDWGYASDRSWLTNTDGTISYCRRVGEGNQARCDRYDGTTWTSAISNPADLGYHDNRTYLRTKDGPAVCGRAGDQSNQLLVCNVLKSTGWVTSRYSTTKDWGYTGDRSWLTNTDGTVSYCRRGGAGDQALCDSFDGTTWTTSTSPRYDLGYPDTF
jgi:surface antigen